MRLQYHNIFLKKDVFQSTHPRGVRRLLTLKDVAYYQFQSTHPRGVRPFSSRVRQQFSQVSIHAPTRGATSFCYLCITFHVFQSTHPRGVRRCLSVHFVVVSPFQSTHPRGVRPSQLFLKCIKNEFQSTHPRGVRL